MNKLSHSLSVVTRVLASVRTIGRRDAKLSRLDFGILEVAMMVAALDGEILDAEYAAFMTLAEKCRGYTPENARTCADEALRRGGYLMAIAKVGGYTAQQRIGAFVDMAVDALPRGFVDGELSDLRRAFVLWIAMGVSDGDFSDIECKAIEALQDRFARVMATQTAESEERWAALVPAIRMLNRSDASARKVTLLEAGFTDRAAELVRDLAIADRREAAEAALKDFVEGDQGIRTVATPR